MINQAVYPGTFDPVTFGHIDVIKRASSLFNGLLVAVAEHPEKKPLFSLEERTRFIIRATQGIEGITVKSFNTILVDFAKENKAKVIIRGLRAVSDFEYEFQMALMNKELEPKIETLFIMSDPAYSFVSSKMIKQITRLKGDISKFVPDFVTAEVRSKFL